MRQQHAELAYRALCESADEKPYLFRGHKPDFDEARQSLKNDPCPVKFVIVPKDGEKAVGYCYCYEIDTRNCCAKIGLYLLPGDPFLPMGIEATGLLVNYLFANWDLRKIYTYTERFPYHRLGKSLGAFFRKEGCLRAHYAYRDRTWDEHIFALYRMDLESFNDHLEQWVTQKPNL
jgi:RimJ/RimL family protein N-acetyltransferase